MNQDEVAQLRALEQAATPGPWFETVMGSEGYDVRANPDSSKKPMRRLRVARCGYEDWETDRANAALIAATRNALPGLLDAAEEAETLRAYKTSLFRGFKEALAERDALRAELDALRGRVAGLADGQGHEFAVIITALNAGKISGGDAIRAAEATVRKLLDGPA